MGVGAGTDVVGEVPAGVVRVVVEDDVVAIPEPVVSVVVIVWGDGPEEAAKSEVIAAAAFEAVNVVAANFTSEMAVFPGVVLMIVSIATAGVMADPVIVAIVDVRGVGVVVVISEGAVAFTGLGASATFAYGS